MNVPITPEAYKSWAAEENEYELRYKGKIVFDSAKQARTDVLFLSAYIQIGTEKYPYHHMRFFRK